MDGLVALLTDDVRLAMPPIPFEYRGREAVARLLKVFVFRPNVVFRLVATGANGHPAFGMYLRASEEEVAHANGVMVFAPTGGRIFAMTRFDTSVLALFGLPAMLSP